MMRQFTFRINISRDLRFQTVFDITQANIVLNNTGHRYLVLIFVITKIQRTYQYTECFKQRTLSRAIVTHKNIKSWVQLDAYIFEAFEVMYVYSSFASDLGRIPGGF